MSRNSRQPAASLNSWLPALLVAGAVVVFGLAALFVAGGSGGSGGSGGYGSSRREMYPAVCAQCGKDTQVPFQPRGDRPVYCSDCFSKQPSSRGRY